MCGSGEIKSVSRPDFFLQSIWLARLAISLLFDVQNTSLCSSLRCFVHFYGTIRRLLRSGFGEIAQSINVSRTLWPGELLWSVKSVVHHPKPCFRVCRASGGDVVVFKCDYSCVISTRRLFTGAARQQTDAVNPLCFCVQMSCFVYLWLSLICCVCVLMLSWVTVCSLLSSGEHERREKLFSSCFSCSQTYSRPDKLTALQWVRHLRTPLNLMHLSRLCVLLHSQMCQNAFE